MRDRVLRRGQVIDAGGQPIADAMVSVVWGTAPTPEIGRRTDETGRFQVALPPGRFRVEAVAPGGATGLIEVDGGAGDAIVLRIETSDRPS